MPRFILGLFTLAFIPIAAAGPIAHSGRLLDSTGVAIQGPHTVQFSIYAATDSPSALWTESDDITLEDGYYSAVLGDSTDFPSTLWDGTVRFLGISIDGTPLEPRTPIHAVPHAISAASITGPLSAPSADITGTLHARSGVQLEQADGSCPAQVTEGTLEYRTGSLRICTATGWDVLATKASVDAVETSVSAVEGSVSAVQSSVSSVTATTASIAANYLTSTDYQTLQTRADTWVPGSYCIIKGSGSCPSGFSEYHSYVKAINNYSGASNYVRYASFADSGVFPHSTSPYSSELRLHMCCR